ncbi:MULTISPECIES: diguanylate cyclase [unclassified Agrobacterium]|uniref:diguanylate cyclase n=1 Tax=unclassified Agrobacterium TaxID=2632611 RepID=UPI00244D542C|nr:MULTISPECIES: diguanylate cyclase [unclassified Agrobacterium]MDH0616499.1 diguanylate cyclase [Agrobacterium sp. GD03872]MDH0699199.1 diguanylate cyclase [Agrobacterium sp. GD03871]MDH1061817.1 diguanylate cyclase [Agrobacterium sp. GD03992]MDH2213471.1 diguanylate cyclase [Agrobacterium sp. GD03643]MDH2222215.1 diguanylate cyclase [Agrobacterium sp. GD03638]
MRLSTITNLAYAVTLILTTVSATTFILSARSASKERAAIETHLELNDLGEELAIVANERTEEARLYIMRGDEQHLAKFYVDEDQENRLETNLDKLSEHGASQQEQELFLDIRGSADTLDKIERQAIGFYRSGRQSDAQQLLFGNEYYQLHEGLLKSVSTLRETVAARTQAMVDQAKSRSDFYGSIAKVMLALTALMFLAVLYFVLSRRVAAPLIRMSNIVMRLARQDYSIDVPDEGRRDEIGEMNQAIRIFRSNGLERERLDAEHRKNQRIKDLILQMMHRIQACQNQNELSDVVSKFMPQIFPAIAGRLLVFKENSSLLQSGGKWSDPSFSAAEFLIDDCWALRRGRPHTSNPDGDDVVCHHLQENSGTGLCIPLTALGETVGLLYLEILTRSETLETERLYLELLAENIGLAVANLQLRQRLVGMAKQDALTGLSNRRSLDEALNRHLEKPDEPLACLMLDIDYFKRFNDRFGHDAGDAVMQYVAQVLSEAVGDAGHLFRFGGEEFTVLMPGAGIEAGMKVAEKLRRAVEQAPVNYRGRLLDPITVSVGIATAPAGGTVSSVLERADAALLNAKQSGRNRWVSFDTI